MTPARKPPSLKRQRLILVAVFALFMAPILVAWLLTSSWLGWHPASTVNQGTLVEPPVDLGRLLGADGEALVTGHGHFTLIVLAPGACGAVCQAGLEQAQRVRMALGKDSHRVRVALLGPEPPPGADPKVGAIPASASMVAAVMAELAARPGQPAVELADATYIVDGHGLLMMRYAPGAQPRGALKDLERLLRAQRVD